MTDSDKNYKPVPAEQPAVRTTIVGGRPPGPGKSVGAVPRGIEVLVKKAAVDPEFKVLLLAKRSAVATEIGLGLSEAEKAMLDGIPEAQLGAIIANTAVSPKIRPAFLGRAAAVMLAALGTTVVTFAEQVESGEAGVVNTGNNTTVETGDELKTGVITGKVTDEDGDVVEGALVSIKGVDLFATTDNDGHYEIENVPDGSYKVEASRVGFDPMIITGVPVVANVITNTNFVLGKPSASKSHGLITGISPRLDSKEINKEKANADITAAIRERSAGIQNLYTREIYKNPNLGSGELLTRIVISEDGYVSDVIIVESTINSTEFESRVISTIMTWSFPATGNEFSVEYPFAFINTSN
jgi:hypothetical protein